MNEQLSFQESEKILSKYQIKIPKKKIIKSLSELNKISLTIGYPKVMKIISKDIIHKTDVGGVVISIADASEAKKAYKNILENIKKNKPKAKIEGVLVQKMHSGIELIIGMKRDPQFGPVILFGLGGIFVEAMKDVSMHISPVNKKEAIDMIKKIKGFNLLKGARGTKPADINGIAEIIVKLSKLSMANKIIEEIDFNPVIADGKEINIVDVRIIKKV